MKKYIYSFEEYIKVFESLGSVEKSDYEKNISISDEYGSGKIRIVDISSLKLIYLDFTLNQDLKIFYDVPSVGYKIVLPIDGSIIAEKNENAINKAFKDKLLIAIPNNLGKSIPSLMHIPKDQYYKAISIMFNDTYLDNIYIRDFKNYWNSIVDKITDNRKQVNCSVDVTFDIKALFLNLLPDNKISISDVIEINSKVYEIIFKLQNLTNQNGFRLNVFEKKQIEDLKEYLEDNILESKDKISLKILAKRFSINRNKMQEAFKHMYGETIFAYYRRIKLKKAVIMIEEDELNICDIARMLSYKSGHSFRTAFKKQYGILPSELKKTNK